ncbi:hypothetical protein KAZ01_03010 [Candidatus Gracilibacteria bacterium]|nr:hypothetical protein [Candidatus Gracilibacteria bacterium]
MNESDKIDYWNKDRELVVNKILDKGKLTDLEKSLITKLTSGKYTIGQLDENERELFYKILGKDISKDKSRRAAFWSVG